MSRLATGAQECAEGTDTPAGIAEGIESPGGTRGARKSTLVR